MIIFQQNNTGQKDSNCKKYHREKWWQDRWIVQVLRKSCAANFHLRVLSRTERLRIGSKTFCTYTHQKRKTVRSNTLRQRLQHRNKTANREKIGTNITWSGVQLVRKIDADTRDKRGSCLLWTNDTYRHSEIICDMYDIASWAKRNWYYAPLNNKWHILRHLQTFCAHFSATDQFRPK